MKRKTSVKAVAEGMKAKSTKPTVRETKKDYDGNTDVMISTGSTLLDLAISGGRVRGGGVPGGIFVEAFGPNGSGKTVLLCELAGGVQRQGGEARFFDPEARLNKQFASMFGLDTSEMSYDVPDRVPEVFAPVRTWEPKGEGKIHGVFADSLAALSTDMEMDNEDGDKMGMRRAKEFSEQLRKTCRIITQKNYLMVASNQVRQKADAQPFQEKYTAPGGEAIGYYASLRLQFRSPQKIWKKKKIKGKEVKRAMGITTEVYVYKNSVWEPYHSAPLTILFDYGIDSIRDELQYVKDFTSNTVYTVMGQTLDKSIDRSILMVENDPELREELKEEVIDLWEEIQASFKTERKPRYAK